MLLLLLAPLLACTNGKIGGDSGAPNDGGSPGDGGSATTYHPAGFADPTVHGIEAKMAVQDCKSCHGADLSGNGSALSCDSCHTEGWRTSCTFCHGGGDNSTGAPPEDIDDSMSDATFGAHTKHVTQTIHGAFDCTECHVKPTDVLSDGHLWDGTAGVAEVDLSGGLSHAGSWNHDGMTCANMYCHGNGQGNNGTVTAGDGPLSCHSCHADMTTSGSWSSMSGEHRKHLRKGFKCSACHQDTVDSGSNIISAAKHVNGQADVVFETTDITYNGSTCNGRCHNENHSNRHWN